MTTARHPVDVDRLDRELSRATSIGDLAGQVFRAVQEVVPNVFACLATTDPMSGVITHAYKSRPLEIGDEEFTQAEYGGPDVNQFREICARPVPVGVLSVDTGGNPERCVRFRDFMAPRFGFTDELRVGLVHRGMTWGALAIYRGAGDPSFTAADGDRIAAGHTVMAAQIQRVLFRDADVVDSVPEPAILILDADDRPREMTRAARDRILDLGGWEHGALPAGVLAVAVKARVGDGVFVTRTRLATGHWLTLRATRLEGPGTSSNVAVTIDVARPEDTNRLTLLARGVTVRELDVVGLVMKGASTKDIAATLHLSPHTVQDHLKSVFAKLAVNSRRELISRLIA